MSNHVKYRNYISGCSISFKPNRSKSLFQSHFPGLKRLESMEAQVHIEPGVSVQREVTPRRREGPHHLRRNEVLEARRRASRGF